MLETRVFLRVVCALVILGVELLHFKQPLLLPPVRPVVRWSVDLLRCSWRVNDVRALGLRCGWLSVSLVRFKEPEPPEEENAREFCRQVSRRV